jgi:hypothetical protein
MTTSSGEVVLALEPTTIAEWDVRDIVFGERSAGLAFATREEAQHLLDRVSLGVPRVSRVRRLAGASTGPGTHGADSDDAGPGVSLSRPPAADAWRFDFHLMELPVSISVPAGRTLTRLWLGLRAEPAGLARPARPAEPAGLGAAPVVAYDIFPALGPGPQRLVNPVAWDLSGEALGDQFTAYVIWRAPRSMPLRVTASLLGELQETGELYGAGEPRKTDEPRRAGEPNGAEEPHGGGEPYRPDEPHRPEEPYPAGMLYWNDELHRAEGPNRTGQRGPGDSPGEPPDRNAAMAAGAQPPRLRKAQFRSASQFYEIPS